VRDQRQNRQLNIAIFRYFKPSDGLEPSTLQNGEFFCPPHPSLKRLEPPRKTLNLSTKPVPK